MPGRITVSPQALIGASPEVAALAEALVGSLNRLVDRLDAIGSPWGQDEAGAAFAETYVPVAVAALTSMGTVAGAAGDIAELVGRWAKSYPEADAASAQELTTW